MSCIYDAAAAHLRSKLCMAAVQRRNGENNMKTTSREEFEKQDQFGIGAPNEAYAQYFIGNSYLKPLTTPGASVVFLANVTFEPGCRKLDYVA